MSLPPPPGLKAPPSTASPGAQTPSTLPARPPPSINSSSSFKQNYNPGTGPSFSYGAPGTRDYDGGGSAKKASSAGSNSAFTGFAPRAVVAQAPAFRAHTPTVSAGPAPPTAYTNPNFQAQPAYNPQPQQPAYYPPQQPDYADHTPMQIRNPFPLPGQQDARNPQAVDPEMEAQIAQWQSAYASKDNDSSSFASRNRRFGTNGSNLEGSSSATSANTAPLGSRSDNNTTSNSFANKDPSAGASAPTDPSVASIVTDSSNRPTTVLRSGGGTTWSDSSLLEWDPAHFRLFVGNLAGEVTDDSLLKAFSKFPSVQKARVVRDKRTTKSKGYGFVSFKDGDEYFRAARDMQGKYIGSHPVLLRKSTTEIKAVKQGGPGGKNGKHGKGGKGGKNGGGQQMSGYGSGGGGAGVKKQKVKGGLKILG